MAGCRFEILVSAYLDGELTAEERALFEKHVAQCEMCSTLVAQWKEVESALRRQTLRQALMSEGELSRSVQRSLSQSGAFRRARRRSRWHRLREAASAHWLRYAVAAAAAAAVLWGVMVIGQGLWRPGPRTVASAPPETAAATFVAPGELLAQSKGLLERLVREAGREPGAVRLIQLEVAQRELPARLARCRLMMIHDAGLRQQMENVGTAMLLVARVPQDRADAEGRRLADAISQSGLLDEIDRLRQRLMVEVY